ncbi:MAG: peptidyl-prolyl cis-trans isomerase [Bacteroidia bacterium]|nr:peptidyl-prolyl cis-trans isomerase [Bacteroidia bacterium]
MNQHIDTIDAYLDGKLSQEEGLAFEARINAEPALKEMVESQRNLRGGMERLGVKSAANAQFRRISIRNKIYKWGLATIAATVIAGSAYLSYNDHVSSKQEITYELPATNELGGTDWADADRNLPTQLFTIDPDKDTVIETSGGIIFAIPAGAFLDAKDPMTIEVREALTSFDVMKAGLSTTSNGALLETGGMFYLNARNGETSLKLNPEKPVCANVPTDEIRPGMQLFDGERQADGSINWVNPKPMEKPLIPVDIFSLNFYPPGYLNRVAELGFDANQEKVTDSIYYSYSGRKNELTAWHHESSNLCGELKAGEHCNDSARVRHILVTYSGALGAQDGIIRSKEEARIKAYDLKAQIKAGASMESLVQRNTDDPGSRLGNYGDYGWFTRMSWNVPVYVIVPAFVYDIGSITVFESPYGYSVMEVLDRRVGSDLRNHDLSSIEGINVEIDPARIAAIRSEEFQNTLIATKEFEERLQVIFSHCEPGALDLYVNNLDKKMYEIDSMVFAKYRIGEFEHFYERRDGGVAVSQSHMKKLQEYYAKKQEAVRTANLKLAESRTKEQRKQDSLYFAGQLEQQSSNSKQWSENFNKEFNINLTEAYRQLGIEKPVPPPANAYYAVDLNRTGWNNVDRYVFESTANRTTLDYTDPKSGKKAVIKYEELKINIADAAKFSQIKVYLVSDSLPCFMKVNATNGVYSEKLNELMEYSLVVLAESDGQWHYAETPKVTPGTVNVILKFTDEASLRKILDRKYSGRQEADFQTELNYMKATHKYNVRKQKETRQEEIDRKVMEVIFPCELGESDTTQPEFRMKMSAH